MLKTLVIHPKDESTDYLSHIYEGRGWDVINFEVSRRELNRQIKAHDRIIMMGHGDANGLYGYGYFVINRSHVYHLRNKQCIYIWCYANDFVHKHQLTGFYTGMIISEYEEAMLMCVRANVSEVEESNVMFSAAVREAILSEDVIGSMNESYHSESNPVIHYNNRNLFIKHKHL